MPLFLSSIALAPFGGEIEYKNSTTGWTLCGKKVAIKKYDI